MFAGPFLGALIALGSFTVLAASPKGTEPFDEEMNGYHKTAALGAVAQLQQRLETGAVPFEADPRHGYLLALLRELNIPVSSQLLVASKTSPNRALISPKNPRALYFNDQVAVAYVPGAGLLEVASQDPKLGAVFFTVDQKSEAKPRLVRDDRCLECHASSKTLDVPGLLVRSFRTEDDGEVDVLSGKFVTHRTPIESRWGGYYVTGTHGSQAHLGNLFGPQARTLHESNPSANGNVTNLSAFLDVSKFPDPGSDIVALLVLDHQVHLQNLLTRLSFETAAALRHGDDLRPTYPAAEAVLRYLLFTDEVHLRAPIQGTSSFTRWFEEQGRRDRQGRSLRQFDLRTRLFKHPCSFMIHSPAFDALPVEAKRHLWRRLWQILSGEDTSPEFGQSLRAETKQAIREILIETKQDLPAYWRL